MVPLDKEIERIVSFYNSKTLKPYVQIFLISIVLMVVELLVISENTPEMIYATKVILVVNIILFISCTIVIRKIEYAKYYLFSYIIIIFTGMFNILLFGIVFVNIAFVKWELYSNLTLSVIIIMHLLFFFIYERRHYIDRKIVLQQNIFTMDYNKNVIDFRKIDNATNRKSYKKNRINFYVYGVIIFIINFLLIGYYRKHKFLSSNIYDTPMVYISLFCIFIIVVISISSFAKNISYYKAIREEEIERYSKLYTSFIKILEMENIINENRKEKGLYPIKIKSIFFLWK